MRGRDLLQKDQRLQASPTQIIFFLSQPFYPAINIQHLLLLLLLFLFLFLSIVHSNRPSSPSHHVPFMSPTHPDPGHLINACALKDRRIRLIAPLFVFRYTCLHTSFMFSRVTIPPPGRFFSFSLLFSLPPLSWLRLAASARKIQRSPRCPFRKAEFEELTTPKERTCIHGLDGF
jgi:hypothetical protein